MIVVGLLVPLWEYADPEAWIAAKQVEFRARHTTLSDYVATVTRVTPDGDKLRIWVEYNGPSKIDRRLEATDVLREVIHAAEKPRPGRLF